MLVLKLGGAALGDAANFANAADYLGRVRDPRPVAVVSAMRGVTDRLLAALDAAAGGAEEPLAPALAELEARHRAVADALLRGGPEAARFGETLRDAIARLGTLLRAVAALREATPKSRDLAVAFGERLAARLFAAVLTVRGVPAEAVDGEDLIVTDEAFGSAYPIWPATRDRVGARLGPLLARGTVPVAMGFVGATPAGATTTLGRGGTDFSASILAWCLDAREVWYLKEVDGIMTADPRAVPTARKLDRLSYDEVAELSYFGAKVLHPIAIHPLREKGIPCRIRSVYDFDAPGTRVGPEGAEGGAGAKALTSVPDVCVLTVEGGGMQGVPGMAGRVFGATARAGVNVLMISQSSSEQSISLVIPARDRAGAVRALEAELELELAKGRIEAVSVRDGLSVVAMVGAGMRGVPGIAGRLFSALGTAGINVVLIAQGSSELNISFVIATPDVAGALGAIHEAFGMGRP